MEGIKVTKQEMGEDWPLLVDSGVVLCLSGSIVFQDGENYYALNGNAASKYPPLNPIWSPNPNIKGAKKSIRPLINIGLTILKEQEL